MARRTGIRSKLVSSYHLPLCAFYQLLFVLFRESQEFLRHHPLVLSKLIKPLKPGEWPANSPDLNVIENLMAIVKRKVQKRLAKLDDNVPCTAQLYQRYLQEEWNAIPQKTLHNLVDSMPKRLQQCLDKHGDATKY